MRIHDINPGNLLCSSNSCIKIYRQLLFDIALDLYLYWRPVSRYIGDLYPGILEICIQVYWRPVTNILNTCFHVYWRLVSRDIGDLYPGILETCSQVYLRLVSRYIWDLYPGIFKACFYIFPASKVTLKTIINTLHILLSCM